MFWPPAGIARVETKIAFFILAISKNSAKFSEIWLFAKTFVTG
jgi:hypothetical protein